MNLYELKNNKARFFPKMNEKYSFIDVYGRVMTVKNQDDLMDRWLIKHHPVFKTKEEAENYLNYLDLLFEYNYEFSREEWKDNNIDKWLVKYDFCADRLYVSSEINSKCPDCIYFKTFEDGKDFIKEAGAENIKKFMFDIWD